MFVRITWTSRRMRVRPSAVFTAAYGAIARGYATIAEDATARIGTNGRHVFAACPAWKRVTEVRIENLQHLTRGALKARAASTSYLPKGDRSAASLNVELDALFVALAVDDRVTMRMKTTVIVARS